MKVLPFLFLLSAPLASPQEPPKPEKNEAEQLFEKMEGRLSRAKTLAVRIKGRGVQGEQEIPMEGSVAATGNKLKVELVARQGEQDHRMTYLCDGAKVTHVAGNKGKPKTWDAPEKLGDAVRTWIVRAGLLASIEGIVREPKAAVDDAAKIRAVDFRLGPKEKIGDKECQVLEYALSEPGKGPASACKLWMDASTHSPVKRESRIKARGGEMLFTEEYLDLKLDEAIDDSTFEPPKK